MKGLRRSALALSIATLSITAGWSVVVAQSAGAPPAGAQGRETVEIEILAAKNAASRALWSGDIEELKKTHVYDARWLRTMETWAEDARLRKAIRLEASKKWDEARAEIAVPIPQLNENPLAGEKVEVNGDKALIRYNGTVVKRLMRVDGKWKNDLVTPLNDNWPDDPEQMAAFWQKGNARLTEILNRLRDGKYGSPQLLKEAIDKIHDNPVALDRNAMPTTGRAATTAPTTAPASVFAPSGTSWKDAPAADAAFDRASAERFAWLADTFAQSGTPEVEPAWTTQVAGLYDIARRAAPNEVRFQRGYIDASLTLGRREQAISGLAALRKLDPTNELAQVQTLDLALDGLESADAKAAYLEQVVAAESVTAEVRSHAAVQAYTLYTERGEDDNAARMLKRSLEISPQNMVALNVHLTEALTTGSATDKANRLKDVLMASPFDPRAVITLAHLASANGANAEASQLYSIGTVLTQARGATPSYVDILSQIGATALTGDARLLAGTAEVYLRAAPNDPALHTARVVADRLAGKSFDETKPLADEVRGTWLGRVAQVSEPLNRAPGTDEKDVPKPSTAPSQPMPPIDADVAKLRELKNDELNAIYASALVDLAYYDAMLRREVPSESLSRAIANLVGEQSPMYALAEGVRLMRVDGQAELAKQKLQAIEKDDDRAAIALAELERAAGNADVAKQLAADVLKRNPSADAALFATAVALDVGAKPEISDEGKAVGEVAKHCYEHVSRAWQRPRDFYLLTAEPIKVGFEFGEPILATLTLRTTSQTPVTVGPSGMLNTVVNFDAVITVSGLGPVPAIASARLAGPIRLNPGETYKQVVRIDQLRLSSILMQYPTLSMPMRIYMTSNSVATNQGAQLLPGGAQSQVGRVIERRASPVQVAGFMQQAYRELREGPADVRLRRFELFSSILPLYRSNSSSPAALENAASLEKALADAFDAEPSPRVRAWMTFVRLSGLSREELRKPESVATVRALITDPDEHARAVGAMLALKLPLEIRKDLAAVLAPDAPETPAALKDIAFALQSLPDKALETPTTQPTTQPAQ